jgi:hypothetical protein
VQDPAAAPFGSTVSTQPLLAEERYCSKNGRQRDDCGESEGVGKNRSPSQVVLLPFLVQLVPSHEGNLPRLDIRAARQHIAHRIDCCMAWMRRFAPRESDRIIR